jgi:hypothetical protein
MRSGPSSPGSVITFDPDALRSPSTNTTARRTLRLVERPSGVEDAAQEGEWGDDDRGHQA